LFRIEEGLIELVLYAVVMADIPPIQLQILQKLYGAERLRYSEMRPEDVENDLFNYHLQSLVKRGFVSKNDLGYSLSTVGLRFINTRMPLDLTGVTPQLFQVCVLCFVLRERNGVREVIHQERASQPFYGDRAVPGGKVRHGEKITDAASRKLYEDCGLRATFTLGGVVRVAFEQNSSFLQDILFHICFTQEFEGQLVVENVFGRNYWVSIEQAQQDELHNHAPIQSMMWLYSELNSAVSLASLPFFYRDEHVVVHSTE
jgi:ADP-ribose pyrophosphatase YjhB (NUDIX family)